MIEFLVGDIHESICVERIKNYILWKTFRWTLAKFITFKIDFFVETLTKNVVLYLWIFQKNELNLFLCMFLK